ncbi:hypothetical protein [Streptomyces sp. NBC_01618]|uniref:hypothetical protein n=1 Tax=Streptomyces sp. NBC_01618 TaxID=2975900 RepID=UPI003866EB8D|nr:hypothetical protein OH735_01335 [Streptomyces sp. NBC_01618]
MTSRPITGPGRPFRTRLPREDFVRDLRAIQDPERWLEGRRNVFDFWLGNSGNAAGAQRLEAEMASFGFDMWAPLRMAGTGGAHEPVLHRRSTRAPQRIR